MEGPMNLFPVLLASLVAPNLIVTADDRDAAEQPPAEFRITTRRADDAVTVRAEEGRTVVDVQCPFGISRAVLERRGATWPEAPVLRLHLKGLERFRASNGRITL